MPTNLERLQTAGLIKKKLEPEYEAVIVDLSDAEVTMLEELKKDLDKADIRRGKPKQPNKDPEFATFMLF